ncbi:MAG: hypothetical protein MPK62_08355 [Alphaproteobacteria bacterium]|nr:hypothetical protein [Alphaproteobacteria bacterium]
MRGKDTEVGSKPACCCWPDAVESGGCDVVVFGGVLAVGADAPLTQPASRTAADNAAHRANRRKRIVRLCMPLIVAE